MIVTAGSTNKSVYFYVVGDAGHASPGEPVTGLLFSDIETGGSASYMRQGAARVDLTLITLASASAAHSDGGFILVDDTNMPGVYRCDFPDAAFATGVDQVVCQIVIASANNAVAAPVLVDITDVDLRDGVRAGLTALPNAAADAAGGLPISDAGGLAMDTLATIGTAVGTDGTNLTEAGGTGDQFTGIAAVGDVTNLSNLPTIPANWITAAGINADAITAAKIADNAIATEHIADGAITAGTLATDTITAAKIAADAIGASELAADAVAEIWAKAIESNGSITAQEALSVILAAVAGVTTAGGATLKDPSGTTTRITATINASNERTAMTLVPSA